jgi:diguanylate cyclase (GGDEF)-like protein/PAS domain S-box-containing protein
MQQFNDIRMGYKLALAFGVCLIVTLTIGGIAVQRFLYMDSVANMITREVLPGTVTVSRIGMTMRALRVHEMRYLMVEPKARPQANADVQDYIVQVAALLPAYERVVTQPEDRANLHQLKSQWRRYMELHAILVAKQEKNDAKGSLALFTHEMKSIFMDQLSITINKMLDWNSSRGIRAAATVKSSNVLVRRQISLLLALGILFSGLAAGFMTRLLMRVLGQLAGAADGLARGDVRQQIDLYSRDEIGQVAEAFRALIAYQQEMSRVAAAVAAGDLTQSVVAKSEKDVLGHTFNHMIANLRQSIEANTAKSEALQASEQRYRSVVENVKDTIFTTDKEGRWTFLNPAWTAITGYNINHSLGQSLLSYVVDEDSLHMTSLFERLKRREQNYYHEEIRFRTRNQSVCWVEARIQSTIDANGDLIGFFGTLSDITERKQAETQLQRLALHDTLTGLPNRLLFQDRVRGALVRMQSLQTGIAVFFLDLDNFKYVNGSMGHEAGDVLLQTIAARLQKSARSMDTIARLGGDEFTLLLEGLHHIDDAIQVAEQIVAQLQLPIPLGERQIFASASIGIAYTVDGNRLLDDLLRDADIAMYQAKSNGKGGYAIFDVGMHASAVERVEIETGLRMALERGELRVHYQPLIDLDTGRMTGIEALVRWEHPELGLLPPGKFIAIAEETGLIVPIGYWVLEESCRQRQTWKAAYPDHPPFIISVNLSGKQLMREDIVERVRDIIARTGICPEELKLEITESVMMADVQETVTKLRQLKLLGVQLAMDDFGTGYSSMASLNLFPLDTVKIDRSFIAELHQNNDMKSVIAAIIMLAKAMNLNITGEGIETEEQLIFLQGLGCHVGQGYYFAKPMSAEALDRDLANKKYLRNTSHSEANILLIQQLLDAA